MGDIIHGDCLEVLKQFPEAHFDAIVTDPPYGLLGLEFMGKEWDGADGFRRSLQTGRTRDVTTCSGRTSKTSPEYRVTGAVPQSNHRPVSDQPGAHDEGYRNMRGKEPLYQQWCQLWAAECLRVLKPGGHLLAFGGTRTYHRLACAIEDAGFEIRDSLHWIYGSGFPKSLDVSKAIDKAAGAEREVVGYDASRVRPNRKYDSGAIGNIGGTGKPSDRTDNGATLTASATEDAARWEGWGTALKPAHEPVVVARKPLTGTVASNVLQWGTGGLNVDGCRVGSELRVNQPAGNKPGGASYMMSITGMPQDAEAHAAEGRWPPNILLSEEAAGQQMISYGDTGGASRFFPQFNWDPEYDAPFMYCAKAPPSERPKVDGIAHPTCKPLALMRWLVRLVTPPGGIVLDPFGGTGTTAEACICEGFRYVLIEREADYIKLIRFRLKKHLEQPSLFGPEEI